MRRMRLTLINPLKEINMNLNKQNNKTNKRSAQATTGTYMQMQDFVEITHTRADTECLSSMQAAVHTIYWIAQEGAHCFARGGRAPSCPRLATGLSAWRQVVSVQFSHSVATTAQVHNRFKQVIPNLGTIWSYDESPPPCAKNAAFDWGRRSRNTEQPAKQRPYHTVFF